MPFIQVLSIQANAIIRPRFLSSRMAANQAIWAAGLVLQCALVLVVFWKGIMRRFPLFAALIVFYPLRAGSLFALAGRVDADAYNSLFNVLGLVEVPLLAAVEAELLLRLAGDLGGWTRRRVTILLLLVAAVCGLTWIALRAVPERQLADRVQVCMGFSMLALFAAVLKGSRSWNLTCISAGFAAFAASQLAGLAGRAYAMTRHDSAGYIGWSYVPACGYLGVVVFWLVGLRTERRGANLRAGLEESGPGT